MIRLSLHLSSLVHQRRKISQCEVLDFFWKLTFHMNKTFKNRGKSVQLPYANEAKFRANKI